MDSASSAILQGVASCSCRDVVSVSVMVSVSMNVNVAGIAASDGVSDLAGGLVGDSAGDLAGLGWGTGIGGRPGSIRSGVGQVTITVVTPQDMRLIIPTTAITRLLLGPKITRAMMLSRRRLMKATRHPHLPMERSRCRRFSI